jgi:hypothetical protein
VSESHADDHGAGGALVRFSVERDEARRALSVGVNWERHQTSSRRRYGTRRLSRIPPGSIEHRTLDGTFS